MTQQAPQERLVGAEGIVKLFDPRKGFGFIIGPQRQDIFAHFSCIHGEGFRILKDGTSVVYDAERTDKGWKATKVTRLETVEVTEVVRKGYTRSPRR